MSDRIIIIGASGLIGSVLAAKAASAGHSVIGTHSGHPRSGTTPLDLRTQTVRSVIPDLHAGDTVFLLSAYSSPGWIFQHPDEARALNLDGTLRAVVDIESSGAHLVFMSSVEVFDGTLGNYREDAEPRPLNLYGKMKAQVELALAKLHRATIVRTGWNVGWDAQHRCVVKLTYESLLQPQARMASDNTFSIADVNDTATGLLRLVGHSDLRHIHLASPQIIVRTELAETIQRLSRKSSEMHFSPTHFSDIAYSEPRARCNHLNVEKSIAMLGMQYRPAVEIIREKVRLLDQASLA